MIIGLVNQKGGCGKSTTAAHFAYWLSLSRSVILIDADAQQSSSTWISQLEEVKIPTQAILDPEQLFETVDEISEQYDAIIIDGPAGLSEVTKSILDLVDLALVPCQPSGLDLSSSSKILQLLRHRQKVRGGLPKTGLFLSRAIKGTLLLKEATLALGVDPRFPLLKSVIYQRQCIADAPVQQTTVFGLSSASAKLASTDYQNLFQEALTLGGIKN